MWMQFMDDTGKGRFVQWGGLNEPPWVTAIDERSELHRIPDDATLRAEMLDCADLFVHLVERIATRAREAGLRPIPTAATAPPRTSTAGE